MSDDIDKAIDQILTYLKVLESWSRTPDELVRRHLYAPDIHLYVRINPRHCGADKLLRSLVLADINIAGHKQRQGVFTRLLRRLEAELPALNVEALVVENVGNPHLLAYLERIGYQSTGWGEQTVFKEARQAVNCQTE
ncbi:hypothetical protein D3C84_1012410 [compost metagenome]